MNKIAQIVKEHLENENVIWETTEFTLVNKTHGYSLWIANDRMLHLDIYLPMKICFTKEERNLLSPLVDIAIEKIFIKLIESNKE